MFDGEDFYQLKAEQLKSKINSGEIKRIPDVKTHDPEAILDMVSPPDLESQE